MNGRSWGSQGTFLEASTMSQSRGMPNGMTFMFIFCQSPSRSFPVWLSLTFHLLCLSAAYSQLCLFLLLSLINPLSFTSCILLETSLEISWFCWLHTFSIPLKSLHPIFVPLAFIFVGTRGKYTKSMYFPPQYALDIRIPTFIGGIWSLCRKESSLHWEVTSFPIQMTNEKSSCTHN